MTSELTERTAVPVTGPDEQNSIKTPNQTSEKGKIEEEKCDVPQAIKTSDLDALVHVVKSSLGAGVLAMPFAFKNAGLVFGLVGTVVVGMLCTHCSYIMVKCSQDMCAMLKKSNLGYTETCEEAFRYCANRRFSKYSTFVRFFSEGFMLFTYFGTNTIYILLVSNTFQYMVESHFNFGFNIRYYILVTAIPIFMVGIVKSMKYLVPFSAIANIFLCIGFCIVFYYVFQDLPSFSSRPKIAHITKIPLFFSTVLCGMEGIGTILPIENSMKNPGHFLGFPGVLTIAMSIVITLFISIGFFGYLKYGNEVSATITLNLPLEDQLAESVKALVGLAVLFTYGLQLTASMEIIWRRFQPYADKGNQAPLYYKVRSGLIIATVLLAIAVPNLGPVISLIGAVGFSVLGFLLPALIQTVIACDQDLTSCQWVYLIAKNLCLALIAIFALITGTITSLSDIVTQYS